MINNEHFPEIISQLEFDYGLYIKLPKVHSKSKETSYIPWQSKYSNLKTTCHINPGFFLWTNFLGNLLLAKYFTSVAATSKRIARNAKIYYSYAKTLNSLVSKKLQNFDWSMQISFHASPNHVSWLEQWNEVNASFFFFLKFLFWKK